MIKLAVQRGVNELVEFSYFPIAAKNGKSPFCTLGAFIARPSRSNRPERNTQKSMYKNRPATQSDAVRWNLSKKKDMLTQERYDVVKWRQAKA